MECQFCHNKFSNKQNLNAHQRKVKYCLKIQGKTPAQEYKCDGCEKKFLVKNKLKRHQMSCSAKNIVKIFKSKILKLESKNIALIRENKILKEQLEKTEHRYDKLS